MVIVSHHVTHKKCLIEILKKLDYDLVEDEKKHVDSSKNTGTSIEVIKKVVTTNYLDDRCLKAKSTPHVGQVHSQGCLPRTNADRVPRKATRDQACATVESCSVKEVEIQNRLTLFLQ